MQNRGKQFEDVIKKAFQQVPGVSIDRLHDQMTGYKVTSANICDFIVYKKPYEYYIECKSVHGNTLPFSNITDRQWNGMLEKSKIPGVFAGVICWWVDKDTTKFIPIQVLESLKSHWNYKSIRYDMDASFIQDGNDIHPIEIQGKKKRVFYEYDMATFLKEAEEYEV